MLYFCNFGNFFPIMFIVLNFFIAPVSAENQTIVDTAGQSTKGTKFKENPQFSYAIGAAHGAPSIEIAHGNDRSFPLNIWLEKFARWHFRSLNDSIYFNSDFLRDPQKVREYHLKKHCQKSMQGEVRTFKTSDNLSIYGTFFNRGSDKLLVIGEGFTNAREVMSPFISMFPDYDLILFDFRGQGLDTRHLSLSNTFFGVDTKFAQLGAVEELDVFAVIDGMKKEKKYSKVYGIGLCYSAFIFLKAAALRPEIFDKLVLDGCWTSVPKIVEKIRSDFKVIVDPQRGGWNNHCFFKREFIKDVLEWTASTVFGLPLNEVSILNYLDKIKNTPTLFFYGKDDLMVHRDEFELIWNGIKTEEKTAVITTNPHVRNHLKQKELYRLFCELFFNYEHNEFKELIDNTQKVISIYSNRVLSFSSR